MPPSFVKTISDTIYYYYAKLVIAPSAGLKGSYGFIVDRYKAIKGGRVSMSDYDRELFYKEAEPVKVCAYCGKELPLTQDHVVCCNIGDPLCSITYPIFFNRSVATDHQFKTQG